jgi:hypothetical protein
MRRVAETRSAGVLMMGIVTLVACASERATPSTAAESGAPAAVIVCDGKTTVVETPVVETTAEGVVFEVAVPDGSDFAFVVHEAGRGDNAETGPFVWVVPPGTAHLRCLGREQGDEVGDISTYETLRIVDPGAFYKSLEFECANASGYGISDGSVGQGEPEEQAVDRLQGLRPDDVVERAAYPDSRDEATVRVVRDGAVVGVLEFENLGQGWTYLGFSSCPDAGLSA